MKKLNTVVLTTVGALATGLGGCFQAFNCGSFSGTGLQSIHAGHTNNGRNPAKFQVNLPVFCSDAPSRTFIESFFNVAQ